MDDTIYRQAAIDFVGSMEMCDEISAEAYKKLTNYLEDLPSAQPTPKTGRWEESTDYYNRISGRCSACGWEAHLYEDDVVGMPYCPNCGAKMDEEENK